MRLPRPNLPSRDALRRPAVLAPLTTLALAALLGTGLVVARAVDPGPTTTVEAPASPGTGGTTSSGGDDNAAVAVNTRDGSTVYAIRLKVVILNSDPDRVDSTNAAVAAASCADCQTVAIALEGVVVTGDAEEVSPANLALAINSECSNCQTLAYAYQNLQTVDGKVRMTGDGRRRVGELRAQLSALRTSGLDILAVKAEVDRIVGAFVEILENEIVPLGRPSGQVAPTAAPAATGSSSPAADPSSASAPASSPTTSSEQPTQPPTQEQTPAAEPSPSG